MYKLLDKFAVISSIEYNFGLCGHIGWDGQPARGWRKDRYMWERIELDSKHLRGYIGRKGPHLPTRGIQTRGVSSSTHGLSTSPPHQAYRFPPTVLVVHLRRFPRQGCYCRESQTRFGILNGPSSVDLCTHGRDVPPSGLLICGASDVVSDQCHSSPSGASGPGVVATSQV